MARPGNETHNLILNHHRHHHPCTTTTTTATTVQQQQQIFQALEVHPRNQRLHTARGPLPGPDDLTLAQLEVLPEEEIRVVNAGEFYEGEGRLRHWMREAVAVRG